jgi:hypothetical protein
MAAQIVPISNLKQRVLIKRRIGAAILASAVNSTLFA